jgi:OOP family OmpA-OmpF porin
VHSAELSHNADVYRGGGDASWEVAVCDASTKPRGGCLSGYLAGGLAGSLALLVLGLTAPQAAAQIFDQSSSVLSRQNRGFYVGAGAGANFLENNRFRNNGTDSTADYETGYAVLLNIGYAFGNGLRLELEPGYRRNELSKINGVGATGRAEVGSIMANAIYDLDIHTPFIPLVPHVGVGAGYARIWNSSFPHNGLLVNGHDNVPAFQGIAGVEYALSPGIKLGVDYRYFLAHDADFRVSSTGLTSRAGDFNNHSIMLTARYEFGGRQRPAPVPAAASSPPPPPPIPQAAPAPQPPPQAREYQVYFALNSATLTPDARQIVQRAAQGARQGQVTRIEVIGHTDTTGSPAYNRALSLRRAEVVRAELVRDGVPADEVVASGQGESGLAVPTPPGVNEPRNRRVEIRLEGPGS